MNFKVGDRVVVVKENHDQLEVGTVFTVLETIEDFNYPDLRVRNDFIRYKKGGPYEGWTKAEYLDFATKLHKVLA